VRYRVNEFVVAAPVVAKMRPPRLNVETRVGGAVLQAEAVAVRIGAGNEADTAGVRVAFGAPARFGGGVLPAAVVPVGDIIARVRAARGKVNPHNAAIPAVRAAALAIRGFYGAEAPVVEELEVLLVAIVAG